MTKNIFQIEFIYASSAAPTNGVNSTQRSFSNDGGIFRAHLDPNSIIEQPQSAANHHSKASSFRATSALPSNNNLTGSSRVNFSALQAQNSQNIQHAKNGQINVNTDMSQVLSSKQRNKSALLQSKEDKEVVGKSTKVPKNMQNYTFGGKKNIKGSALEKIVKKEIENRQQLQIEELNGSFLSNTDLKNPSRVGTASYNKRLQKLNKFLSSQPQSPRQLQSTKAQSIFSGGGQSRDQTQFNHLNYHSTQNSQYSKGSNLKFTSEQRYIEAKNEIPRFNEDVEIKSQKSKSIFTKRLMSTSSKANNGGIS